MTCSITRRKAMSRTKFYYIAIDKKRNETVHMENIHTKEDLKKVIKKITTTDLKRRDYHFQITAISLQWFGELYKKKFFTVDGEKNVITINVLPNGIRRTRVYKKKVNNEKTFDRTIQRIKNQLFDDLGRLDFAFEIETTHRENDVNVTIKTEDLRTYLHNDKSLCALINFDKNKWTYKFVYLGVSRDYDELYKMIKNAFEKHTSSTRNHRAKRENNFK